MNFHAACRGVTFNFDIPVVGVASCLKRKIFQDGVFLVCFMVLFYGYI